MPYLTDAYAGRTLKCIGFTRELLICIAGRAPRTVLLARAPVVLFVFPRHKAIDKWMPGMTQERPIQALEPDAAVKGTAGGRSGEDGPVASYAFFK